MIYQRYERRSKALTDLVSFYLQLRGFPVDSPHHQHRGSMVKQRQGLFTQLWGSPSPGEREDVFRASLIMAASEEINRQGPAGMLQLLLLMGGRDGGEERWTVHGGRGGGGAVGHRWKARRGVDGGRGEKTVDLHTGGYIITLALWFHICMAALACKSTFLVWPDANRTPDASA